MKENTSEYDREVTQRYKQRQNKVMVNLEGCIHTALAA